MTIKYRNKNVSAEKEGVVVNASLDKGTGILTLSLKNQYDDTTLPPIQLQLHDISLNIVKKSRAYIEELTETTDEEKIIERASTLFLVPLDDDEENPDAYQELVWSEDKGEFENVGTTRIDLKPIQEDITQLQTVLDIEIINNIVKSNILETIENDINDLREVKQNKNIVTSWSNPLSDFKYPSEKLTKDNLDTKINKTDIADDLTTNNSNKVLSAKQGVLIETKKQDKDNLVTIWSDTLSDTKYPSEKLTKEYLDDKLDKNLIYNKLDWENNDNTYPLSAHQGYVLNTTKTNNNDIITILNDFKNSFDVKRLTIKIVWEDNNNENNVRPNSVTVPINGEDIIVSNNIVWEKSIVIPNEDINVNNINVSISNYVLRGRVLNDNILTLYLSNISRPSVPDQEPPQPSGGS